MEKKNENMNTKKILVSFLVIASLLFLATTVSADEIVKTGASGIAVKVDGINVGEYPSIIAGDTISVKVKFQANLSASNVRIRTELEGDTEDVTAVTPLFDVEEGMSYSKILTLKVPSDLEKDELNGVLNLNVKIWNSDDSTENTFDLNVQRPSYDVAIKSVMTSGTIDAGETTPVDVVLKNVGYNDAEDIYVTVSIPELNIAKSAYFGDIVTGNTEENSSDDDDKSTLSGRLYLEIPYSAKSGVYTLKVEVKNDEATSTSTKEVSIDNGVSEIVMKSGSDVILLNPTNKLQVYTVKYNSNEAVYVVPAASSKTVPIVVPTGDYKFDVSVYSGANLVGAVTFSGSSNQSEVQLTNPVFIGTVVLGIFFLVLLVILIVVITKKPQKTEEFGESYY